jgi:hypothetical protein
MSRKDRLAAAAEAKSGTFDEMMSGATKSTPAQARTRVSFATPRPVEAGERGRQRRDAKPASNVTPLVVVAPAEGEKLERLFDRGTVESLYDVIDLILPRLHQNDQSVYLFLFRRTHAVGVSKCVISLAELGRLANVGISGVTYSVRRLEASRPQLVQRTGRRLGKGKDQGVEIEVFVPKGL